MRIHLLKIVSVGFIIVSLSFVHVFSAGEQGGGEGTSEIFEQQKYNSLFAPNDTHVNGEVPLVPGIQKVKTRFYDNEIECTIGDIIEHNMTKKSTRIVQQGEAKSGLHNGDMFESIPCTVDLGATAGNTAYLKKGSPNVDARTINGLELFREFTDNFLKNGIFPLAESSTLIVFGL